MAQKASMYNVTFKSRDTIETEAKISFFLRKNTKLKNGGKLLVAASSMMH